MDYLGLLTYAIAYNLHKIFGSCFIINKYYLFINKVIINNKLFFVINKLLITKLIIINKS